MLLSESVKIEVKKGNKGYLIKKGYDVNQDFIIVPIEELDKGSIYLVDVTCDYCNEPKKIKYRDYNKSTKDYPKYACRDCIYKKQEEMRLEKYGVKYTFQIPDVNEKKRKTMIERYGVDNPMKHKDFLEKAQQTNLERYGHTSVLQNEEIKEKIRQNNLDKYGVEYVCQRDDVKEKIKQTFIEHYGVDNPMKDEEIREKAKLTNLNKYGYENTLQNKEVKNKAIQTILERYGVENVFSNDEIKEKIKATNLQKYGVENPSFNQECLDKAIRTNIERYGCDNPMKNKDIQNRLRQNNLLKYGVETTLSLPEVRKKQRESMFKNNTVRTSAQQIYLHKLYGGILNFPCECYNLDILVDNINIEYNGGGHKLQVLLGNMTEKEFAKSEIIRGSYVKKNGYKQLIIISEQDWLPNDDILLSILDITKTYFNETNHSWIEFNIDTSSMRNAEHKEGVSFDYGKLRKIKNKEVG